MCEGAGTLPNTDEGEDTKDHVDEIEHRLDQLMAGHRNDPLMVDRAERILRHLHILANQLIDAKRQLANMDREATGWKRES